MATKVQRICQTTKDITQKYIVRPVCVNVFATYFLLLPAKCLEFSNKVSNFAGRLLNLSYKNYNLFTNNKRLITMKQKLFTLLTLLLCAVTSSWATDFVDTYGSLGTITGTYIANGISKITLGENAKANGGIEATENGKTLKFTVSTPTGFTIKTVKFKDSNVDEANITCNDATGTLATTSHYTTLTASADKTSIEFTIPSSSSKKAKLTEFIVTVSSSTTDDYELITPSSISSGTITYTSSMGDGKLVTAMAGVGGPSVSTGDLNFGNGKGFSITTSRPIKAVYCVWFQRAPISNTGWQGYSNAEATVVTGSYDATTNAWTASDDETKFVAFKSSEGSTHKLSSIHIFYYPDKEISTQTLAAVKKGETTLTETTDYTVSGSVITLTAAHKTAVTPSGITLINHITYTDTSTLDQDVTVTFDGTKTDGYFVSAAATIGATDYTVKVPYNAALTTDKAAYSVTSAKANVGTVTVHLTGAELSGTKSITWASAVEGLTVAPEEITVTDGVVNQEFTVSYHSLAAVSEATVNLTFAVGSSSVVVPVTYSSTAADVTTITDVTEATTWDWDVTTNDMASPANGYIVPFGNATDAATKFASGFNYQALAGDAQYFARKSEKCFQGTSLKFHTTAAGYITVVFSNTGKDRPYRYLYLNGSKISNDARSGDANKVTVENIAVEAGDVVLSGYIENASDPKSGNNDVVGPQMLRIYKVIFVPSDPTPYCDITTYQWATYVPTNAVDFSGQPNVEAYIVTGHDGTAIEKTQVTSVPAGTPVLLYKKTEGAGTLHFDNRASSSTDVSANLLKAGTGAAVSAEGGKTKYVLSVADGKAVFKKINATAATVVEGKAYLEFDGDVSAPQFNLDGDVTGIQAIESQKVAMDNEFYNLAGQQVAAPTKGLYIVNGKKVIIK